MWVFVVVVVVALLIALGLYTFALGSLPWRESSAAWGQLGDFIGGLFNPLIASFALVGLALSISVQRETLLETQNAFAQQVRLQRQQMTEATFFSLLALRAEAVESVEWNGDESTVRGRAAIKRILQALERFAPQIESKDIQADLDHWNVPGAVPAKARVYVAIFAALYSGEPKSDSLAWVSETITREAAKGDDSRRSLRALQNLEVELGHVFRATFQVLKFAHSCPEFHPSSRIDLVNYLRAQMSEPEFALFALTALTSIGDKSRAAAIAFDFYEDRLRSIAWARDLVQLFDPSVSENTAFAQRMGFARVERAVSAC
jgi:hypothetical protein